MGKIEAKSRPNYGFGDTKLLLMNKLRVPSLAPSQYEDDLYIETEPCWCPQYIIVQGASHLSCVYSRVSMVVPDGLVPIWRQYICSGFAGVTIRS